MSLENGDPVAAQPGQRANGSIGNGAGPASHDLASLVVDDRDAGLFRVNRRAFTSQEVFELERERVFGHNWVYLGHDSEIPENGDFVRRNVGGRALFFTRSSDGKVRCFFNTCPHRGSLICRQDQGNGTVFQCFYHAWTFNSEGELTGIPGDDAYSESFDRAERNLAQVPKLDQYAGFWFVSFDADVKDLDDHLAGAKEYLDIVQAQPLDGKMRIVEGTHQYSIRANWKLLAENSVDGYHAASTHQTYLAYVAAVGGLEGGMKLHGTGHSLGNGHAVLNYWSPWGRPVARWVPQMGEESKAEIADIRERLTERHGAEKAERICEWNRNLVIYPNLVINDIMAVTVRSFNPIAPDFMEVNMYALAPTDESQVRLTARLRNFLEFLGPGGFATPDDIEALESCQLGFSGGSPEHNDVSRGMHRDALYDDELQMRTFWRQWHADVEGRSIDDWGDRVPAAAAGAG